MMKSICFLLIILCFTHSLSAQNLKGMVSDSQTHQPLPYATVLILKAADSSQVKGTLTDDHGVYRFENIKEGNYLLASQSSGYAKKLMPILITAAPALVTIELLPQDKQLKEVVISGAKPVVEQRAGMLVFNVENSIVAAGNNGLELLKMAPLVTINPDNGISLKGKNNVLVMLDGKIIPGATVSSLLQGMSAEQISKFEMITSPSAKYDASATGGIINIVTKKGTALGLNGSINLASSQSKYGRYNGGLALNYRSDKFNIYGNINLREGKSYKNENTIRYLQNGNNAITLESPDELFGHSKSQSAKMGIDYTINEKNVLGFTFDGVFSQSDNRLNAISYFRNSNNRLDSTLTTNSKPGGHVNFTSYNINYKNTLNKKGEELTMNLTYSRYNDLTRQDLMGQMEDLSGSNPIEYVSSSNHIVSLFNITTFQTDYVHPFNANTTLETGVKDLYTSSNNESTNQSVNFLADASDLSNTHYTENILAAYLNVTHQLKSLKLQAGLRAEQTNAKLNLTGLDNSYLNLFPSASIENKFSDHYQLSLIYSSRIDRPEYRSLIPFVVPIDRYTQEIGNPNLKAAYANSLELTNTFGNISLTLGYAHTHNAIEDFIIQDDQTKVWSVTKNNYRKLENYSASVVIPITITKWWSTNNTVFGAKNIYSADNIGGSSFNRSKFSYNLNSIQSFSLPAAIKAEVTASYNSPGLYGLYYISHYSMVNAGLSKAFMEKKLAVKLGVNDIFHDQGYKIRTDAGDIRSTGHSYTDSRRVTISAVYKFGKKIAPAKQNNNDEAAKSRLSM